MSRDPVPRHVNVDRMRRYAERQRQREATIRLFAAMGIPLNPGSNR